MKLENMSVNLMNLNYNCPQSDFQQIFQDIVCNICFIQELQKYQKAQLLKTRLNVFTESTNTLFIFVLMST